MQNSPFPPGSLLAAFLRDSGGDDQDLSIPQQELEIQRWCASHNYILSAVFKDAASPGSTTAGRDAFNGMMAYFRFPDVQETGILVWKYSRFARDIDDAQFYRADLRRWSSRLHRHKKIATHHIRTSASHHLRRIWTVGISLTGDSE
jgi:DNA invertase Pin-like site-specific DNA recombinase